MFPFPLPLGMPWDAAAPEAGFFQVDIHEKKKILANFLFEIPDNHRFQSGVVSTFTLLYSILNVQRQQWFQLLRLLKLTVA